ncbi:MAG TPA: aminomethyltransferase family protein [Vicinamibacterales bacterium]|nr:aminomethyltransferase family protein [Vicinamibacterales bacterium]
MPVGTPFHDRTLPLAASLSYRDWAGYYAASSYEPLHEHEYNALRNAAGLIDISPLFKYLVSGPDAARLVNRIITRDAERLEPGRVIYTPWCDENGRVLDDGTVARLDENRFRWTAAEPNYRWLRDNASGLDVTIEDVSEAVAALALQGPTSAAVLRAATDADIDNLKYFHVTRASIDGRPIEISRTGYTGDLGYEIWMNRDDAVGVWDALVKAGRPHAMRPVGLLALDVARIEAGLLLIDVDFFSARRALTPSQYYTPDEMGLERLVDLLKPQFIGRRALAAERSAGIPKRIVGVAVEWTDVETLYHAVGLPPLGIATASRAAVPVFAGSRQVGRMTSSTWSPVLKQMIGIATIETPFAGVGSRIEVEHTVDVVRHRVGATVVRMPFFNPARKTALPPA